MSDPLEAPPLFSAEESQELASITYFLGRLGEMRGRDLISAESYGTVVGESNARTAAIEKDGRFRAAMANAQFFRSTRPGEALSWAEQARRIAPERPEGWGLSIDLLRVQGRLDEASGLGDEIAGRFPELQEKVREIRDARDALTRARFNATGPLTGDAEELAEARAALRRGEDDRVLSLSSAVLERRPDHVDALVLLAFASQRLGRIDEALAHYRRLCTLQAENTAWPQWVCALETRLAKTTGVRPVGEAASPVSLAPVLEWSSVAGEFLQDHWQKLILCLAVLLIVVSSTVGMHLLLGPKLWSLGKCALALVYTVTFAAFGAGLMRWGARRAGRMMLLTTLIVVPVNFMLVGEMRLLTAPTAWGLAVLVVDTAALFVLARSVAGALELGNGSSFLATALVALGSFNAATSRGVPPPWGFSAFLLSPLVYLVAVARLNTSDRGETDEERREFTYLALGLLTFALLAGAIRNGVVLRLEDRPALFAVPAMFAAIALVHTAHHLSRFEKDRGRVMSIRFGGLVLSGLAFALALARPPGPSPLLSGNALATAVLGLVLYAATLRAERHPAYLYLAFGAFFFGYFGAFYFVVDLIRAVEEAARQALGYRQKLPLPFKALNGLVFNAGLALLALVFARRWRDERLARHCHYLGLPVSIAACLLSAFEPRAAVLCLSGYSVLYAIAVPVFAQPLVIYLACSALAGALFFGSVLIPWLGLDARALGAAVLGFAFWALGRILDARRVDRACGKPLVHAAIVAATATIVAAAVSAPGQVSIAGSSAFLLAGMLCFLLVADEPHAAMAHMTVAGALGASLCGLSLATGITARSPATFGVAVAAVAVATLAAAEWARVRETARSRVFARALPDSAFVLLLVAQVLAASGRFAAISPVAATLALGAIASLWSTRFRRDPRLVDLAVGLAVSSALVLAVWRAGWADPAIGLGYLALTSAAASSVLWAIGTSCRRGEGNGLYALPCLRAALLLTVLVAALAIDARAMSRAAFPMASTALLVNGVVLVLLSTTWPTPRLTYAAIGSIVSATYLVLLSVGKPSPEKAYVLGLAAVIEGLIAWTIGVLCRRATRPEWERIYSRPLFTSALILTVLAVVPAYASPVSMVLVGVSFLLMIKGDPAAEWLYAAIGSFACAFCFGFVEGLPYDGWMAAAVVGAYALWGAGILSRRVGPRLCDRLQLPQLAFECPFFNAAALAAAIAAALRIGLSLWGSEPWVSYAGLPLSLAPFCLLMIGAYPSRGWVHAAVALASLGLATTAAPWVASPVGWMLAGMALANVWLAVSRILRTAEWGLGLVEAGSEEIVGLWSNAIFGLTATGVVALVLVMTLTTAFGVEGLSIDLGPGDWWRVLGALVLAGVYTAFEAGRLGDAEDVLMALYGILVLALWWLGAPGSPAPAWFVPGGGAFFPLATAALALATVLLGVRLPGAEEGDAGASRFSEFGAFAGHAGFGLALVATVFTKGAINETTTLTLLSATAALGLLAITRHRVESAFAGGLTWSLACACLGVDAARGSRLVPPASGSFAVALSLVLAAYALWGLSGWLRRTSLGLKTPGAEFRGRVVRAFEQVGLVSSLAATAAVAVLSMEARGPGEFEALAGAGVLAAVALLELLLARRWNAEWLVYLAQATLLGAYIHCRHAYRLSEATDAAILTLLGYLDFGLSELLQRLRRDLYARPTLYASLVLPLIPPATAMVDGRLDELNLFLLFTTATFYGVACASRRWKTLGYASAVLFNALLWLAWSRVGWRLSDHPQFFLIPVGLSAILFAEVNRSELGRPTVNAIRGLGLIVVYFSLALPIWQFQSFGSWVTLLLLSLAGIFAGIGLRIQSFLWLGLVGFVLDVLYQLGRIGTEYALAKWGIMLVLGIVLILFVALNEKKRIVATMRGYYEQARQWE